MDRDLLKQSLSFHGQSLFSLLNCEQSENPDFKAVATDLFKAAHQRRERENDSPVVEQFIARKADILFAPSWKFCAPSDDDHQETREPYAIMPPLEQFMEVPFEERRDLFYRDVERGDMVIGRINSIRDFGFFVTIICTAGGLKRDIEDLELTALCPIRDVPSTGHHDDPLSYYQIGDLIRAGVKDIDRYHEKLTISLYSSSLAANLSKFKLGVISKEDLPLHYIRAERVSSDRSLTYEKLLESSLGFSNPSNVDVLLEKLGVSDTQSASLMRGLQSKHFMEEDFATAIRKKQSASWALKCVKAGVDHFKSGRHVEAMNEYNKALEIDTNNVEALVARGALYATKGSLVKAIGDFELALEGCPSHRNAKKYLCQTLVERGQQLEEEEKLVTAEGLYRKAIALDSSFQEAEDALQKLQLHIQKSLKLKEEAAKEQEKAKTVETSAEKLRKILKEEKRMKKKRKRSSSSSSTSSSSSSSSRGSYSSGRKKSKKRKRKRKRSSHSYKKRHRRISSRDEKSTEEEVEWYPAPADTSASFINQTQAMAKLLEDKSESGDRRLSQSREGARSHSFGSTSGVETMEEKRGRFEDDPFDRSPRGKERVQHSKQSTGSKHRSSSKVNGRERESHRKSEEGHSGGGSRPECSGISSKSRRYSSSSAGSEYSRKSGHSVDPPSRDSNYRGSEGRQCDLTYRTDRSDSKDSRRTGVNYGRSSCDVSQDNKTMVEGGQRKELPSNLLDIFSQIAQFEKEKRQKK
ncbi:tetratricopeptide repeat protein 14 [Chanos chanos]|uniref:Tetratricopeptide repeat protein 14 n=1 Tax=Chanos chanos TaxID=29144 RepID=A0A6J2WQJ1_CHACN|nr:tetratricopeptide repeat protein 14 [Chanos chanos]XP_030647135.1 tetratricopeptide repeat protein 14 [Chanos chanos]